MIPTLTNADGPWVHVSIASRVLNIKDPRTLRVWIMRGTVIGDVIGRCWYVRREEYEALKAGEPPQGRPAGWKAPPRMRRSYT